MLFPVTQTTSPVFKFKLVLLLVMVEVQPLLQSGLDVFPNAPLPDFTTKPNCTFTLLPEIATS